MAPVVRSTFPANVLAMRLNGIGAEAQMQGNLDAGPALLQHLSDLLLSGGQRRAAVTDSELCELAHAVHAQAGIDVFAVLGYCRRTDAQRAGHFLVGMALEKFKKTARCLAVSWFTVPVREQIVPAQCKKLVYIRTQPTSPGTHWVVALRAQRSASVAARTNRLAGFRRPGAGSR